MNSAPALTVKPGDQERQLESLPLVQPGITETGVVQTEVLFGQPLGAAETLGDRFGGEFEVHAAEVRGVGGVDGEGLAQFGEDICEMAGFDRSRLRFVVGGGGVAAVAVHRVALPDDGAGVSAGLDRADVGGQVLGDFVVAVAGDEHDFADFARRVERVEQRDEVGGRH